MFAKGLNSSSVCFRESIALVAGPPLSSCQTNLIGDNNGLFFGQRLLTGAVPPVVVVTATNPTDTYMLKVGLTDGRNTEYFWVGDFERQGEQYQATLANTPNTVRGYRNGQRISFQPGQIVDWMFLEPGKKRMHGNFTACALLSKEPPKEAAAFKKQYGLSCAD